MASTPTHPTQPAKPSTPAPQPQHPAKAEPPKPAKPPEDPQEAKFEAHAGPPHWKEPGKAQNPNPPPPDGMSSADEQRERAAEVEAHGQKSLDQRPDDQKPTFDPHALAGGGAFVRAGERKQVPGVTPPTKRE